MGNILISRLLDTAGIGRAYPLVRNLGPGIALERWNRFARRQIASRSPKWPRGLMTIQNAGGYILGLFGFEVCDDLHESRTLCITNIIVPNIPGRSRIWASIVAAAENLAEANVCHAIRVELAGDLDRSGSDRAWVAASVKRSGYALDGARAFKRLWDASRGSNLPGPDGTTRCNTRGR